LSGPQHSHMPQCCAARVREPLPARLDPSEAAAASAEAAAVLAFYAAVSAAGSGSSP
jgi:hypothetical protein